MKSLEGTQVVAKRQGQRGQSPVGIAVQLGQFAENDLKTVAVGDEVVDTAVQASEPALEPGGAKLPKRPLLARMRALGHGFPQLFEAGLNCGSILPPQVQMLHLVRRYLGQDLLPSIGIDDSAQHVMALDQFS